MGQSHHRSFDIEVYAPGVRRWLEVSSVSWFSDYQARRADIRYRVSRSEGHPDRATRSTARRSPCPGCGPRSSRTTARPTARCSCPRCCTRTCVAPRSSHRDERRAGDESTLASRPRTTTRPPGSTSPTSSPTRSCSGSTGTTQATEAGCVEPHAFVLGTVDADGWPQSRYLLARGADDRGFSFFTNYQSAKSAAARPPIRRPRCCSPGCSCTARCGWSAPSSGRPRPRATSTSRRVRGPRRSARGRRRSRSRCPIGPWLEERVAEIEATFADVRRCPPPGVLGWLAAPPGDGRVLAGSPQPPARPPSLHPGRQRSGGRCSAARRGSSSGWHPEGAAQARRSGGQRVDQRLGVRRATRALPVRPDRARAANPRRQLDLHALLARQVHRVADRAGRAAPSGSARGR